MIHFTTTLRKFEQKGEKTGWTYLEIPPHLAEELNPGVRIIYRVKGTLDKYPLAQVALLPMGDGGFILPVNGTMRRALRKQEGAIVAVALEVDHSPVALSDDLLECLQDEPRALEFFNQLTKGHQNYFSKWVESAKTPATKAKRIAQCIQGLAMHMDYGSMIRYFKKQANAG
ncbi:YdeI/OmpD-associated family protein [Rhabdobacter roseus]|uniref:DUF1905 domain-containing protein n=1 Tax=Rhabdobacter roseus TaxID=1655419 RepID=A0A840TRC0_9BACT|nr:YdeI/OmpD-associated family protein [Rhabdobacter roseus]MBB5286866.1 hypothetical protein [Rhabdobacter roseus]